MRPSATELFGPSGTPRVVVVGAGIGGIAAGVKLRGPGSRPSRSTSPRPGSAGPGGTIRIPGPKSTCTPISTATRSSRTTGPAPTPASPNCSRTSKTPSTSSACAATCSWASPSARRPGTTTATSGSVTLDSGAVDDCHGLISRSASSTSPGIPIGPGRMELEGRNVRHVPVGASA